MDYLDLSLDTVAENVALDEALLLQAERDEAGEVLRFWEAKNLGVVLGSGCILAEDVDVMRSSIDGIEMVRRSSGGGTVLVGPGCLCYTLILRMDANPALAGIRTSYEYILGRIIEGFALDGLELAGISDLALGGMKFSGNAQQRKRHHILHHGTILYAFDLERVSEYLKLPVRRPEYRQERSHTDFIRNLGVEQEWLKDHLRKIWRADHLREAWPQTQVEEQVQAKYSQWEWTSRR